MENIPRTDGVSYSRGINTYDNAPAQKFAADFNEFREVVLSDRSPRKGMTYICSALSFGPHDDVAKYPKDNYYRLNSHAEPRRYLPLDLDGFLDADAFRATLSFLEQYSAFAYTTASYTDDAPRARAIIELTRGVTSAEGVMLGVTFEKQMQESLGVDAITFDQCVYRATQPCYTPVTTSLVFRFKGVPLDVDALLTAYRATTPSKAAANSAAIPAFMRGHSGNLATVCVIPETPGAVARMKSALDRLSPDCGRVAWRNIVWAILAHGFDCCVDVAREWSMRSAKYNEADFRGVVRSFKS